MQGAGDPVPSRLIDFGSGSVFSPRPSSCQLCNIELEAAALSNRSCSKLCQQAGARIERSNMTGLAYSHMLSQRKCNRGGKEGSNPPRPLPL